MKRTVVSIKTPKPSQKEGTTSTLGEEGKEKQWAVLGLILVVLVVYGQALWFGFVNWDDDYYLLQNKLVTAPMSQPWEQRILTPQMGYAVPVLIGIQSLLYGLVGEAPFLFHLVNLIIHVLNLWLAYGIAHRLVGRYAFWVALLFGLHPLMVEPVVWVSGLKDLLASFFVLLALYLFLKARDAGALTWKQLVLVTMVTLLAGFTKPTTILSILCFPLVDHMIKNRPLLAIVKKWSLPILMVWSLLLASNFPMQEQYRKEGLAPEVWQSVSTASMLSKSRSLTHIAEDVVYAFRVYAGNYLWPMDLRAVYIRPYEEGQVAFLELSAVLSILGLAVLVGLCAFGLWRRKAALYGLLFAALFYLPVSLLLFPLHRLGDPFLYLPCFGLALTIVSLVAHMRPLFLVRTSALLRRTCLGLFYCCLGLLSYMQANVWQSSVFVWEHVLVYYPNSPQILDRMAEAYILEEQYTNAAEILQSMHDSGTIEKGGLSRLAYCYIVTQRFKEAEEILMLEIKKAETASMARRNHALLLVDAWPEFQTAYPAEAQESLERMKNEMLSSPETYSQKTVRSVLESLELQRGP